MCGKTLVIKAIGKSYTAVLCIILEISLSLSLFQNKVILKDFEKNNKKSYHKWELIINIDSCCTFFF